MNTPSPLRSSRREAIDGARKYAEGRGVRIPVRTRKDLEGVETLAGIKAAT
jgi:hypothetical protein